ncbi:unnamed protein product [Cylindrotheca closterium]|uniref:Uncharacterized protein n=1 Tax=Cylindrotheca closterium TaxID=2856 RepID=A0AAD2G9L9_9STRA|nr:unnamed protein product [Cylindrotheca closterium]
MMDDEGNGPGTLTSIGILLIMILFVGTGLAPMMGGGDRDLSIADSVVTRQDSPQKLKNYESTQDRLSRATIQEKLSAVPVFYLSEGGNMQTDIFLSYQEANDVAAGKNGVSVKVTSLDQVMYPLILQRGRMRMAPPPPEIEKAEAQLSENPGKKYRLIPSKPSVEQANEYKLNLLENDVPLFVADRLAFAGSKGPQLPLFVDKSDCMLSYQRLRSGKSSLPEQPNIRTTTLLDELYSMEKGTRPGVSQLAFYATAEDVNQAASLFDTLR